MVVLLIGLIITALTVPAISSMMQTMNLSQAGQVVSSQINLAQQIAGACGYPVEVRLLQSPNSTAAPYYYSAIQLYTTTGGVAKPVNHPVLLPPNAVISGSTTTLSPYLQYLQTTAPTMTVAGVTYKYLSFRISSQGLVSPFPVLGMQYSYVSVIPLNQASVATAPSNFVSIQINPQTGMQTSYRPGGT
jgi:Tfp pilus assembly protein FimT